MKHASEERLKEVEGVLERLREIAGLRERKVGVFYRKSAAFVHFHEDAAGMFADVRGAKGWKRLAVNTAGEVKTFFEEVRKVIRE